MSKKANGLPKRIAGVKIPKKMRKGRFGKLLGSPQGQVLMTEALSAAAAVAAGAVVARAGKDTPVGHMVDGVAGRVKKAAAGAKATGAETVAGADIAAHRLTYALGEAVRTFTRAMHEDEAFQDAPVGESRPRRRAAIQPAS